MRTLVFDTETTGLRPGNICQLAYIIDDGGAPSGSNFFFKVDYVEPGAENVHGFSADMLDKLSGGQRFDALASRIHRDFTSCPVWVAHNFIFDNAFLTAECKRQGMSIKAEKQFCTMRHYAPIVKLQPKYPKSGAWQYKYPNLSELISFLGITDSEIIKFTHEAFREDGFKLNRHDARYDCAATYLCYIKGASIGHGPEWALPNKLQTAIDNM